MPRPTDMLLPFATAMAPTDSHAPPAGDDTPGPRAEFNAADVTTRFMLAGRAHVTFQSKKTDTRFTYRIVRGDGPRVIYFVAVLTGPDAYEYLGCIFDGHAYAHGRKSRINPSAESSVAFSWVWSKLSAGHMPTTLGVWHEGRCGKCGRRLTTPESVQSGIGPTCAAKGGAL